jgi:hypothetical protein
MTKNTQEMIDAVFGDPIQVKKFSHPKKDKAICEMRLTGAYWHEIAKRYKVSETYCRLCVRKVDRIYKLFIEGEQT